MKKAKEKSVQQDFVAFSEVQSPCLVLGAVSLEDVVYSEIPCKLPLKALTRHGLIAGATGTGKTKSIQAMVEQLALQGVSAVVMDMKGDVSGLGAPGEKTKVLVDRAKVLGLAFEPKAMDCEYYVLGKDILGIPLRSPVCDFGAVLTSRMLDLNETQTGVMAIVFSFAQDENIPLNTLDDLRTLMQFLQSEEGQAKIQSKYGTVASSTVATIMRKLLELDAQGASEFFGLPAFDVFDFLASPDSSEGRVSVVRLMDLQEKPLLFSTVMLKLLNDVYRKFPEIGDVEKPKLVFFIDEAHLIFKHASKALMSLLETIVKLIRSKGIGLVFCTQSPNDIPEAILGQLGLKVQHALRAFTAKDRQAIKLVAQNFPESKYYDVANMLTTLAIGEAFVSALDAEGQPLPLVTVKVRPPESRMGVMSDSEIKSCLRHSECEAKYADKLDAETAKDAIERKWPKLYDVVAESNAKYRQKEEPGLIDSLSKNTLFRQIVRDLFRKIINSLFKKSR